MKTFIATILILTIGTMYAHAGWGPGFDPVETKLTTKEKIVEVEKSKTKWWLWSIGGALILGGIAAIAGGSSGGGGGGSSGEDTEQTGSGTVSW